MKRVYFITAMVGLVCIAVLPIHYYINGMTVYSYGPSTIATYLFTLIFIISTIIEAVRSHGLASKRRRRTILLWQGTWLLAALIQLFFPNLLLVGIAAAFGMVLIYAELENPHEGVDRMTGQYTANALIDYLNYLYNAGKTFAAIDLWFIRQNRDKIVKSDTHLATQIADYLNGLAGGIVFRVSGDQFAIIFQTSLEMEAAYECIDSELRNRFEPMIDIKCMLVADSRVVNNVNEFLHIHNYFLPELEGKKYLMVDQAAVKGISEYAKTREMIESAISDDRVEVFFQPIYDVKENKFSSAEALVRIRDKEGNIIPPGRFIPIAEETGQIIPLGEEIFRQVCDLRKKEDITLLGVRYIEVNLSVVQFDQESLASDFIAIMKEYQIPPSKINLEITETASTNAKRILMLNMTSLIDYGVRFSLDDFGTGRSNLDYFVDMPVDIIKFDNGFTWAYFKSQKARCVMESVVSMVKRMGLQIVSEGVETKEQLETMCSLGVDYIQGYYFSKPIPREEFLEFVRIKNAG